MMQISHHHRHRVSRATPTHRRQGGYIMAMFGLMLVPMLLMVGMSVDVGSWYNRASEMQRAADAAALAGVVWLPNETQAGTVARDVAARNGFPASANISVDARPSEASPERRLRVTISDSRVSSFFYEHLGGDKIRLTRTAYAEYVLPVPLGSPRNFFGTGTLLENIPGWSSEQIYQSVNPFCTDKVNGDRHQSSHFGGTCSGTVNSEYRETGYELYIDAVPGRPAPIEVLLWDPRYNDQRVPNGQITGEECRVEPAPGASWFTYTGSSERTIWGPKVYQYQSRRNSSWEPNPYGELPSGEYFRHRGDRLRWAEGVETCTPTYGQEDPIDSFRGNRDDTYTFKLFAADDTPLDDTDNELYCTGIYERDTPFNYGPYLGSVRWNKLCDIPTGSTYDGRWILRVTNSGTSNGGRNDGSNQWGLVAKYNTSGSIGLCDQRHTDNCPRVYGKDAISVRADSDASTAQFFLAEILPEHAGKTLQIELFDPGEGGEYLRILMPTGAEAWGQRATMEWSAPGEGSGTTSNLPVRVSGRDRFNGKVLTISVDLSGYEPPPGNNWWKIEYQFRDNFEVTDRTTWSARVIGDPVHLIEEN